MPAAASSRCCIGGIARGRASCDVIAMHWRWRRLKIKAGRRLSGNQYVRNTLIIKNVQHMRVVYATYLYRYGYPRQIGLHLTFNHRFLNM